MVTSFSRKAVAERSVTASRRNLVAIRERFIGGARDKRMSRSGERLYRSDGGGRTRAEALLRTRRLPPAHVARRRRKTPARASTLHRAPVRGRRSGALQL